MSATQSLLDEFEQLLRKPHIKKEQVLPFISEYPSERTTFMLDYDDLYRHNPDLAQDYLREPDEVKPYLEEALHQFDSPDNTDLSGADVRITNIPDDYEAEIGAFRNHHSGSVRKIRGQVTKQTDSQPIIKQAAFECERCGTLTYIPQSGNLQLQEPHECEGCERQGPFDINEDKSELADYQKVRVQVPPEKARGGTGEHLDINVERDLVDAVDVGDRVEAAVTMRNRLKQNGQQKQRIMEWYAEGESLQPENSDWSDMDIEAYRDRIEEIAANDPLQQFVESILPTHYGDEHIKRAIALQLFTGGRYTLPDGSTKRGDSHILLIGDPGTNKTGLLEYAKHLYPRSIYTSGNASSGVGLTASAVRDDFAGEQWTLKGGAMVRAHKGLAAIDELDKMSDEDHGKMFEALSKQTISVSKAGINATLKAETKLLAAANPVNGRFNEHEKYPKQFNLDPAFMSRFDLIFVVTDSPDEDRDSSIAERINDSWAAALQQAREGELDEELKDKVSPAIPPEVTRPYIAYAKQLTPLLTDAAYDRLVEAYVEIRQANSELDDDVDAVPVTARKLEGLVRYALASARMRLSDEITVEDAELAIQVVRDCLEDIGIDPETGQYDADIIETGVPKSQQERYDKVKGIIETLETRDERAPEDEVIQTACDAGLGENEAEHIIEKLAEKGRIYGRKGVGWRVS